MKQIDIIKTYGTKRCLVVDNNADERTLLKRLLSDFGCREVDTAGQAEEAIELAQRYRYDIVIADYQLGKGKNGQQLLEELRHQQRLAHSALFVLITAESASQHVLLAIEHQPDDYIGKPITKETLRARLDAALLSKEALREVNIALDKKHLDVAIEACQNIIAEKNMFENDARRVLSELFHQRQEYDAALASYERIPTQNCPLWASLGKARALIALGDQDAAESILNAVITENRFCVGAYDLLAECQISKRRYPQAQQTLAQAIRLSPMSAPRQRKMGYVSTENKDYNAAAHAYRAAVRLSKNSHHESPEDYICLADTLISLLRQANSDTQSLATEAQETLAQLEKKFGKQTFFAIHKALLSADFCDAVGDQQSARVAREHALAHYESLDPGSVEYMPTSHGIQCAAALMDRGYHDEGERLLQKLATLTSDKTTAITIDKMLREPVTQEGIAYAAKLNKRGIEFHKQNNFAKAIDAFRQVLDELPNHIGLNLNLVQAIVSKGKSQALNQHELSTIDECLKRIGCLHDTSPHIERYRFLRERYKKLIEH